MHKIIAFAGSNSSTSINKQLATYAAHQIENVQVEILDLNDFDMPLYGMDHEKEHGFPEKAKQLLNKIQMANGIVLSLAEHNGAYSAVFKNVFDWMSRIDGKLLNGIPMLLMATSPGGRGGSSVLEIAKSRFPYMGGNIVAEFSLPSFGENFKSGKVINEDFDRILKEAIGTFRSNL
jgi:NAD(P)H-dependent FMN reductase